MIGVGLIAYPTVSDIWNRYHQTKMIVSYVDEVSQMDEQTRMQWWNEAQKYNQTLVGRNSLLLNDEEQNIYKQQLSMTSDGMMGYVEIPKIDVYMPIYHGTSEAVLQVGIGHLEGSSLPVGGENTHCVISGHTGLPSAKILTDLDQLKNGDIFYLHVLNETLTYKVDQIKVVEPDDTSELLIQEGKDLCTLVTCTPYGINSHRLLVRGYRIPTVDERKDSVKDNNRKLLLYLLGMMCVVIILITIVIYRYYRKRKQMRSKSKAEVKS